MTRDCRNASAKAVSRSAALRMSQAKAAIIEALTPGRQRSYLYHFAAAKPSATRVARIKKAMPAIFEGRGFLERR